MLNYLEDFAAPVAPAPAPSIEDMPGYEAGFEAGQAVVREEQAALTAALIQHLEDVSFGFAEARQHLLEKFEPCIAALMHQLLPASTEARFIAELRDTLGKAIAEDLATPVVLQLHPDQADAVQHALHANDISQFEVVPDGSQPLNTALIGNAKTETVLDIDALTARLINILSALSPVDAEEENHG